MHSSFICILRLLFIASSAFSASACAANPSGASLTLGDEAAWIQRTVASTSNATIAYYTRGETKGSTPPLIVISGGPGSDHRYMRIGGAFAKISETRQVVMFDQRGTSKSSGADGAVFVDWAADVEAVQAAIGAEKVDLLGHSFGGLVAMSYASEHPENIRKLILVDSTAPKLSDNVQLLSDIYPDRIDEWRTTRANLQPQFSAPEISVFFSMEFVDPALAPQYEAAVADYVYNISVNNALRAELGTIDFSDAMAAYEKPALIVHGRHDAVLAPSVAWKLHQLIPNAEIRIIEQSGHLPFVEQPSEFAEIINGFLSE